MAEVVLEVKDLYCGYGGKPVLKGVGFAMAEGEFVGVIGPNGSGKTTLLRAIVGVLQPQSGAIFFAKRRIEEIGRRELARHIAVVTQSPEMPPFYTVAEFVLLGRIPHRRHLQLWETKEDLKIAEWAMDLTGVSHLRHRKMGELSGGERQLAAVARALSQRPRLLLLDEPTAHLDIGHQIQVIELLQGLNRRESLSVIVIMHDLTMAALHCQRLVLLHDGRLRISGPPPMVLTKEIIEEVYGAPVQVLKEPQSGSPLVIPMSGG